MTLTIHDDLLQGSDAWLDQRRGMVTASVVGHLVTPASIKPAKNDHSRALYALLIAERITGWTDPVFVSDDMFRGTVEEPLAVAKYEEHYAPVTRVGFMTEDRWGFSIGYSPDGLVGDDGLIEVKSRRPKKHVSTILSGHVPGENIAQIQCGLLVSGRAWCDYVSYCGGLPLYRIRVEPDERWFDAIVEAVAMFEEAAAQAIADYSTRTEGLPLTERTVEQEMVI